MGELFDASNLREIILGGQDGLVNVLGIVLGLAVATSDPNLVLIGGLAATFAESISMGAVAYTSSKAAHDYYHKVLEEERREIEKRPQEGVEEVEAIYKDKGFTDPQLSHIVGTITSDERVWLETMMTEEMRISHIEHGTPVKHALIVTISAFLGSLIPLLPFLFLPVFWAIMGSILLSIATLFGGGGLKARLTVGSWKKEGLEMAAIGTASALAGYVIGTILQTFE